MKKLSFTQADVDLMVDEFKKSLSNFRSNQDKFVYEKKFSEIARIDEEKIKKPIIYFSMEAWLEMLTLVKSCDKEIAWQASVEKRKYRNEEKSDDFFYYIKQVFVYPQKVTGTFVDVNEVKYAEWSLQLKDDVYNSIRFQGHSHVNMGVTPSGTDLNTYQNFLDQLNENDYYIFMIMNKRQEFNIMVYDYAQDILFENKDCFVDILTPQGSLTRWTEENMKLVEYKTEPRINSTWNDYPKEYSFEAPKVTKQMKIDPKDEISYIHIGGYIKNGKWYHFEDIDEAFDWFLANPEYINKAYLSAEHKQLLLECLETTDKNPTQPKKRGRPPKGNKKQ